MLTLSSGNGLTHTPNSGLSPLTVAERRILLDTSRINEKIFPPWYDDDDLNEPFLFDKLFMYVLASISKTIHIRSRIY